MSVANIDEKKLKQCIQSIINFVSDTIDKSQGKTNSQQTLDDFRKTFKTTIEKSLSSLSIQCRNYLLNTLYQFHYQDKDKTFSNSFKLNMLNSLLNNLQGCLHSLETFQAAWNGEQSQVEEFIENYPQLKNQSGLYETTLLYSAARNNHKDLVRYLIEDADCSVNAPNEEYLQKGQAPTANKATIGSTPLHAACYQGHLDIVKFLIGHGGDYYMKNSANETPVENAKSKSLIRDFFKEFLVCSYSTNSSHLPKSNILSVIESNEEFTIDCIWEYKSMTTDQWIAFASDPSEQLHRSLIDKPFKNQIRLQTGRDVYFTSVSQFLRIGKTADQLENPAWIRCRGSSLLNFHCYGQWQLMFIEHPSASKMSTLSINVFDMNSTDCQLNSWYTVDNDVNFILETAMNYRRKYVNINLDFVNNEILTFNLENFSFFNERKTFIGFLRWIPKLIANTTNLNPVNNFQLNTDSKVILLTTSCVKQADDTNQFQLKYEDAFQNDNVEVSPQDDDENESKGMINVIQGDLLAEQTDVIVICSLSKYLMDAVFKVGGRSLKANFDKKVKESEKNPVISIPAEGSLSSKAVYFVPWKPNSNEDILRQSIEQLVQNVIQKATKEKFQSIAFPAIGCGGYECPTSVIAQTFIKQCQKCLKQIPMSITFVIQPDKNDIFQEFQQQIGPTKVEIAPAEPPVSANIGNGIIEVKKGDITKQKVDVIIGSSSSENLLQVILKAAGNTVRSVYDKEIKSNPNTLVVKTPPGYLQCKEIFFLKWEPDPDPDNLRLSIIDLIANVVQNVKSHNYTSIAFPALGCGEHDCSVDVVVKTMVKEMKQQIEKRKLSWIVKFIVQPKQQNVYDEFCRQVLFTEHANSDYKLPKTWIRADGDDQIRFVVRKNTEEYKSIIDPFDQVMKGNYTEIVKLERVQNERWYMQYIAHWKDFKKRLGTDTEKRLYHGCPDTSADLISKDCFNRSFAGVNGTLYGFGVYFSTNAVYSHGYTRANASGERCMFVARVLVGKTTQGNSTMKTRPLGFDSTTDGSHMTVTYHDAQAYAEYLIIYK